MSNDEMFEKACDKMDKEPFGEGDVLGILKDLAFQETADELKKVKKELETTKKALMLIAEIVAELQYKTCGCPSDVEEECSKGEFCLWCEPEYVCNWYMQKAREE